LNPNHDSDPNPNIGVNHVGWGMHPQKITVGDGYITTSPLPNTDG